jgi:hypothetical protein
MRLKDESLSMLRFICCVALSFLCLPSPASAGDPADKYSMSDLAALEENESWSELVDHLGDIPPSKRDGAWQRTAERATTAMLTAAATDKEQFLALALADDFTKRYPHLRRSKTFMDKRAEVGLAGFAACFRGSWGGGDCTERLLGFVDADPDNKKLALEAGKLVRLNQMAYAAVPFFERAVAGGKNTAGCSDEDLQLAVMSGLALPKPDPRLGSAINIASKLCWVQLSDGIASEFAKYSKGEYFFENTCPMLAERKMLSSLQAKQCAASK